MLLWFGVIAALGIAGILHHPQVLAALDPRHAIAFLVHNGWGGFAVLGGVFLAITGGARRSTPIWGIHSSQLFCMGWCWPDREHSPCHEHGR